MMRTLFKLAWLLFFLVWVANPVTTINLYVASTGSDSTGSGTQSNPYLTIAKAQSRIPCPVNFAYVINLADATYNEGFDWSSCPTGGYGGNTVTLLGNNGTPANVVLTSTVTKTIAGASVASGVYISGASTVILQGLTINVTAANGVLCQTCDLVILDNVTVEGTISAAGVNVQDGGHAYFQDAVNVSGFCSAGCLGVDIHGWSYGTMPTAGTLTITGPGGASTTSACLVVEHQSGFTLSQTRADFIAAALTISGCQLGINLAGKSGFSNFGSTGNISITNGSTTPSGSDGIAVQNGSSFSMTINGNTLTVDHYTNCMIANSNSEIDIGVGGRTFTNCTFSAGAQCTQGAQCILF